jgi:hypothetical protein
MWLQSTPRLLSFGRVNVLLAEIGNQEEAEWTSEEELHLNNECVLSLDYDNPQR